MQDYGLMNGIPDGKGGKGKDFRAEGGNPCLGKTINGSLAEWLRRVDKTYDYASSYSWVRILQHPI